MVRNIASQIDEYGYQYFATLLPQTGTCHPYWALLHDHILKIHRTIFHMI